MVVQEAAVESAERSPIPGLIKRNTLLLALSQAFAGAGSHLTFALGPLIVLSLTGSAALTGLGVSLNGISRFLVSYHIGKIADAYGRKPGILVGLGLALVGGLAVGSAVLARSFPGFVLALLVFGMGMNAAHQLRVAAADMYPPARRGEGLGYVLTGYMLGAIGGPIVVAISQATAPATGIDPLGLPWFFLPALILPGAVLVWQVRPDPREIAARLGEYFPGYRPPRQEAAPAEPSSVRAFFGHFPKRAAFVAYVAAYANMAFVMVITSVSLAHHGHQMVEISVTQALHTIGMFGFSIPFGRLADRFGRRMVLLLADLIQLGGALAVALSHEYIAVTVGAFLVGLGWSASNVATTALLADTTGPRERGRAVGLSDSMASAASITMPLLGGVMIEWLGFGSTAPLMVVLLLAPLPLLLLLREPRPGQYEYPR